MGFGESTSKLALFFIFNSEASFWIDETGFCLCIAGLSMSNGVSYTQWCACLLGFLVADLPVGQHDLKGEESHNQVPFWFCKWGSMIGGNSYVFAREHSMKNLMQQGFRTSTLLFLLDVLSGNMPLQLVPDYRQQNLCQGSLTACLLNTLCL